VYRKSDSGFAAEGFADADYAEDVDRHSITGAVFVMSGGLIAWTSKKQGTIALSTLEAEYAAISHAVRHILWHNMLMEELGFEAPRPFKLNSDNRGAIALSRDPQFHGRSKHIDIRHHFIRDHVERGNISIFHIRSEDNLADIFTKPLPNPVFTKFVSSLTDDVMT
jgi:hypothetical protein